MKRWTPTRRLRARLLAAIRRHMAMTPYEEQDMLDALVRAVRGRR
jgi:hypothetical protein